MRWFANIVVDFGYYYNDFRWTFYLFVTTLIIIALGLPITRSIRVVVRYQSNIFLGETLEFYILSIDSFNRICAYWNRKIMFRSTLYSNNLVDHNYITNPHWT